MATLARRALKERGLTRSQIFELKSCNMSTVVYMAGYNDETACQRSLARTAHAMNCCDT